jgi:hypothetical protein
MGAKKLVNAANSAAIYGTLEYVNEFKIKPNWGDGRVKR